MQEEYRKIKGYENYSVSNFGNVRNEKTCLILKQHLHNGYYRVEVQGKKHLIHRLIAEYFIPNPNNKAYVDHIDNNRSNNRIDNLRWVTTSENNYNMSIKKTNKSGVKGVIWNKNKNKWEVQISHKGKRYHLGYFTDKDEAIKTRKLKANELFGEFTNKCERIVNLNIKIPKNTKLNINVNIEDDNDEEYKLLEQEFLEKMK
jgi:hypothetical protein